MGFGGQAEVAYVQSLFRAYYQKGYSNPYIPPRMERREYGYMLFGQRTMVRHLSLKDPSQLLDLLKNVAPAHVYRSAAIYHYPSAPMEEKGWIGADLIFDIDADHLETPCKASHDFRLCTSCGLRVSSDRCSGCGSDQLEDVKWVCDICLEGSRAELVKLLEFMEVDLGIRRESMVVSFSGNRGYHLAVYDERFLGLGREERQEIVEYLTGANMDPSLHGLEAGLEPGEGPDYSDHGWRGRIARQSYTILSRLARGDEKTVKALEGLLGHRIVQSLKTSEDFWRERPRWDLLGGRAETRAKALKALVALSVESEKTHIDTVVTTDIHRLLRMADTLNGKTGLRASTIPVERVEEYDPLREAVAIPAHPETRIRIAYAPRFRLGEEEYGPYSDEEAKLPAFAASYLICRGVARLAERRR